VTDATIDDARVTIKHPKGVVIYFGIDTNDFTSAEYQTVAAYFRTIKELFREKGAPFEVGVYGSGQSCDLMRRMAQVDHCWLAGVSIGWNGTRDFYNGSVANWHLFQNALEVPLEVPVDTNLINPKAFGKFVAFDANGLLGPLDDSAVRRTLRFISATPAPFHKTPGGDPLIHIVEYDDDSGRHHIVSRAFVDARSMVTVIEDGPEWSKIEVTFVSVCPGRT
jgi:hypothetical protein